MQNSTVRAGQAGAGQFGLLLLAQGHRSSRSCHLQRETLLRASDWWTVSSQMQVRSGSGQNALVSPSNKVRRQVGVADLFHAAVRAGGWTALWPAPVRALSAAVSLRIGRTGRQRLDTASTDTPSAALTPPHPS